MSNRPYITKSIQDEVAKRSNYCCEYCKYIKAYCGSPFAIEHIIPIVLNGLNHINNLAYACNGCNLYKHAAISALDPISSKIVPLFHPRKDKWSDHFKWSDDFLKMEGLTATGRATIIRLKTNRQELINLRSILIEKGHPPT